MAMASQAAQVRKLKEKELQSPLQRLSIPSVSSITTLYRIRDSGGRNGVQRRGQGCFAFRDIPKGTILLAERPLFSVRPDYTDRYTDRKIEAEVNILTLDSLRQYQALSGPVPNQNSTDVEIFTANSIGVKQTGRSARAIFVKASRFNHSCAPNAYFTWNPSPDEHIRTNAMVPIQKNEEIFINYIGQTTVFASQAQRHQALLDWRITCDCPLCTTFSVQSDQRRQTMQTLKDGIKANQHRYRRRQHLGLSNDELTDTLQNIRIESHRLYDLCVQEHIIYPVRAEVLQWTANSYIKGGELAGCHPSHELECYNHGVGALRTKLDLDIVCDGYNSPEVDKTLASLGKLCRHIQEQDGMA